jgi:hypothetical protein
MAGGRALIGVALALDLQRIARGFIGGEEFLRPFSRDGQLASLANDDGPTEQREHQQRRHRGFALGRCLLDREFQGVGGQKWTEVKWQHYFRK